jgi:hypothetical protein
MKSATACLGLTTSSLSSNMLNEPLQYPSHDAEIDFNEIRLALAPWVQHAAHVPHKAAGYAGPWIEHHFIQKFEGMYDDDNDNNCLVLSDYFGPYILLFVPWVDHWVTNRFKYKYWIHSAQCGLYYHKSTIK